MSQFLTTSQLVTNIPNAYPFITVTSIPVGISSSGIIVIFGEADGGDSYQHVALKNNYFTPNQLAKVKQQYVSGQIVEAFAALAESSADPDITGSANRVYIAKTNQGTRASAVLDTNYGTLADKNWGLPGNNYKYQITSIDAEVTPTISGNTIPALGAPLNGDEFSIRLNGGAVQTVHLSSTATNHDTIPHLVTELNSLLVGVTASAGAAPSSIALTVNADSSANRQGFGKSLELFEASPGDLASLGLTAGMTVSSQEPGVEVAISNSVTNLSQLIDVTAQVGLTIGYQGTSGTLTINSTTLSTSVTGPVNNLSIPLSQFATMADLVAFINTQTGYTAAVASGAQQLSPSVLDKVSAIGIASTGAGLMPGRVKKAASDFSVAINNSALSFTALAGGLAGLPSVMANPAFLAGGLRGGTLAVDIVNVLAQLGGIQANIVVPCFSQDASRDITAGLTDSSSTYTIAAINALTKSHCLEYSTPLLQRNRMAIMSLLDTYANDKAASQRLGNYRCALTMQQVTQVNTAGVITLFQPWYAAVIAAGMQAGGFYKSLCNKAANVISFTDPVGFDSGDPGDVSDALSAGLLFLSEDTTRNYWVSDQTSYGYDTNFVYNSIQAVYCSDLLALDLAQSFKLAFVGKAMADVDAAVALAFLSQKMNGYKSLRLIAASTDAPLGYKNQSVQIVAPTMTVNVEIKLDTALYFIPININISQVQNAA